MAHVVRTSIIIDGSRLQDTQFTSVSLQQTVGWHHHFEIRLRQDANKGVLTQKAQKWVGKSIQIGMDLKPNKVLALTPIPDIFKGIIISVGLTRRKGTAELVVKGQSPTIAADDGVNTQSFTDKGLQEIVDEVLKDYEGAFPESPIVEPKEFTESIPYIVQYKESNFAYIARLANRFGEWFYYDGLKLFFGKPSGGETIKLDFGKNSLIDFDLSVRAIPLKFELKGYDYIKHESLSEESDQSSKTSDLGQIVKDISTGQVFPQASSTTANMQFEKPELKNLTKRTEQILIDEMVILNGSSRNPKLKIGVTIEVSDNEIGENYGSFVITNLTHDIMQGGDYMNHFEAIPAEVATSPLSTMPEPNFCETQLAKVTDVNDEKSLGRVRVKFLWQEGSEEKSPWIRVASPYTGKDKGFYIIPEVDDQVLVAFENNHPDKPYVLTGMYNGDAKPEWFDAKNHVKGFKSKGQNQWKFDDKNKHISIHAPNAITMSAGNKIIIKTGGKEDSEINFDAGEGTINISAKTINILAAELINIDSKKDIKMKSAASVEVKSSKIDITGGPVTVKGTPIKLN